MYLKLVSAIRNLFYPSVEKGISLAELAKKKNYVVVYDIKQFPLYTMERASVELRRLGIVTIVLGADGNIGLDKALRIYEVNSNNEIVIQDRQDRLSLFSKKFRERVVKREGL